MALSIAPVPAVPAAAGPAGGRDDVRPAPRDVAELVRRFVAREADLPEPRMRSRLREHIAAFHHDPRVLTLWSDPWALAAYGVVPWAIAERWGQQAGADPRGSRYRVAAAIRELLVRQLQERSYLAFQLRHLAAVLPNVIQPVPSLPAIAQAVAAMRESGLLVLTAAGSNDPETKIALPEAAHVERSLAAHMRSLVARPLAATVSSEQYLESLLAQSSVTLSEEQKAPIRAALRHRLLVVTGPAGTGKTVVIREMVRVLQAFNETVLVATPTGKAAEVLQGRGVPQATTVHALLSMTPDDTHLFTPLTKWLSAPKGDRLIIDEGTMPDAVTYERIFAALPPSMKVVIFGDGDQLPPVGPGAVMEAALSVPEVVPVIRLTTVRRTAGRLTRNGLAIRSGKMPEIDDPAENMECAGFDVRNLPAEFREAARKALPKKATTEEIELHASALWCVDIATRQIPLACPDIDPARDVQVITPQAPGPLGTAHLAGLIRDRVNPPLPGQRDHFLYGGGDEVKHRARPGDEVIATDTIRYQDGRGHWQEIRNGSVGRLLRVETIGSAKVGIVHFTAKRVDVAIKGKEFSKLNLRYALTVDRMQGSECKAVVQVVHYATSRKLATRRRLYTGYTRGRQVSALLYDETTLRYCLDNVHGDRRVQTLPERLRGGVAER